MLRHVPGLVLLALLALGSSGCAVMMFDAGHEGGSGSLSSAAAQARTDSTRKTPPPPDVGWVTPPAATVEVEASSSSLAPAEGAIVAPEPPRPPAPKTHRMFVGLVAGGGALGGKSYDGFGTLGLSVGGYPEPRLRVDGTGTINTTAFKDQALLGQAFKEPMELSLDVTARYYLTPDQTFLGLYPLAGVGTGTLFWDYAQPVTVVEDGAPKTLEDDRINYFSLFGGAGMSLMQTRYVHVGGNLVGGVRFYGWHTGSGLKNDLLKTTGYVKALIELSFRVAKV